MPMGYCKMCERLVPIALSPSPWDGPDAAKLDKVRLGQTRAAIWLPMTHEDETGRLCPGVKKPV